MATRSVIAKPAGESWKGRHEHWDGYPSNIGPELEAIIQRDGAEQARQILVDDNYGWSNIDHEQGETDLHTTAYDSDRFVPVVGYGIAYTERNASPEEWETPESNDGEWAYVIRDDGSITVFAGYPLRRVGTYPTDGSTDWSAVEQKGYAL